MSMVEDLGARLRQTADELPLDAVAAASERLRLATDLLMWVRQSSASPIGVPELGNATEHLEQAGYALRVGQDTVGEYLAAIGLGYRPAEPDPASRHTSADEAARQAPEAGPAPELPPLHRWWAGRVDYLADHDAGADHEPADRDTGATHSADLLRRAAQHVRAGDRDGLRRELARVEAPVGLGLSALSPPALRRLATDLLGHEPGPADLSRLSSATSGRVRDLMPRVPEQTVSTLLARVCRTAPSGSGPANPIDSAVAGAVLTGVLLQRLGRDPGSLPPSEHHGTNADAGTNGGGRA